jgi:sulfonate transport system substrate-binding protein
MSKEKARRTLAGWARALLTMSVVTLLGTATSSALADVNTREIRIGYQKAASDLVLLKAHGTLEKRLSAQGVTVKWIEFPAGPQLLEGLNVGSIDFGYVGEAPPVFALAGGTDFVYTAYEIPTPQAEGILVPQDSPIHTIADLKGKKIAFNKGSDVNWLVVSVLKKAGLKYTDIQPIYLAPADARAAFQKGAVDAWAIWDPFQAAAQQQTGARQLINGVGVVNHYQYFLTARAYAQKQPEVLKTVIDEVGREGQDIRSDYKKAAAELAPIQGLSPDIIETSLQRYAHVFKPIDATALNDQQKIADAFYDLKLIPTKLNVHDAVLNKVGVQ